MRINILFGGKAGQGPNILTHITAEALVKKGYYVFYSRDYQSLIRGGHNFNVLTFSDEEVYSNDSQLDILIELDEGTEKIHKKEMKKECIIMNGKHENMYFAGRLFKLLGISFNELENELRKLGKKVEENLRNAKQGYDEEKRKLKLPEIRKSVKKEFMNGSQAISEGAIKSGLDIYYAYPMTPATSVLTELAQKQIKNNFLTLELENEIAVINAAIGSAITGVKAMVGTSGGGFDLMTEGLSLTGIAEVPLVLYLAQRPGPATGVATYTGQGDLNIARHGGHGEFVRIVLAPGNPKECQELVSQCFYFSQKYKIPAIILSDKHLAESFYTLNSEAKITKSEKLTSLGRYNSYEKDEQGNATENAEIIEKNIKARLKKKQEIEKEAEKFSMFEVYGKQNSKNLIISYGSTKGAILDAIKNLDCAFVQIKYIEPFPKQIENILKGKNVILVENNATGMLGDVIREKTGFLIEDKNKILKFNGRPFLGDELRGEIERRER
ncbi:MAG: 2-oxoacid:acceptor oxidoreductase family protein [Nanoarchaeota archaeon]|nr:2-oxoacid:acceptor oxidoreductase family protein [Nanoarchaeota archaeon]